MSWVVLSRQVVDRLVSDVRACTGIAHAFEDILENGTVVLDLRDGRRLLVNAISVTDAGVFVAVWWPTNESQLVIQDEPLLSIWASSEGGSILSLDDNDRGDVFRRACQLATKIWDNQALPAAWHQSHSDRVESIYAASTRRFQDLRLAYGTRTLVGHKMVDVGRLYRSFRRGALVQIVPESAVKTLPQSLVRSEADHAALIPVSPESSEDSADDQDLVIAGPTEGARHLFSLKYDQWVGPDGPLTRQQRRVINQSIQRPLRIHGPAGSGKTLVLILKALHLLRDSQAKAQRCHILLVVTSTAVQGTVRSAIEAIDDQMLLATTRSDPQFLDVETLHGWCIRELGLGGGPGRVLERDPKASKAHQLKILGDVFDEVYSERYERLREFLSPDFRARVDGKRDHLLRDLQWEIGIRIKGRGFRRSCPSGEAA